MEGEANIFFEDTYIGKTLLGTGQISDTLDLSLGRDKKVSIRREQAKAFTSKKFIGSKKEETKTWTIIVRNNKPQAIRISISDQIPVSVNSEIEVEGINLSNAQYDEKTGELKWELNMEPNEKKELEIKYVVKYPKNRTLFVE